MPKEKNGKTSKEIKALRARLNQWIKSHTYPPTQLDLSFETGVSQTVISLFLGKPHPRLSVASYNKIAAFLEAKENAQKAIA